MEMDSKSIGLCPQGFESPRCRLLHLLGGAWRVSRVATLENKGSGEMRARSLPRAFSANMRQERIELPTLGL